MSRCWTELSSERYDELRKRLLELLTSYQVIVAFFACSPATFFCTGPKDSADPDLCGSVRTGHPLGSGALASTYQRPHLHVPAPAGQWSGEGGSDVNDTNRLVKVRPLDVLIDDMKVIIIFVTRSDLSLFSWSF